MASIGEGEAMPACSHEEADTRMVVHIAHALENGSTKIHVKTVDTDVVVILVGKFHDLTSNTNAEIWVEFGSGKGFCYHSINSICESLGEQVSRALPVFHAFSGCDQTSAFCFKGKKSAWQAWTAWQDLTETLVYLACHPFEQLYLDSIHFQRLERFTVIMYDKTSPSNSINETRMDLFCHRSCVMERLPPTQVNT